MDDATLLNKWHIREFLGYVGTELNRWAKEGNGSDSSTQKATEPTVHHYYSALRTFYNWVAREGFVPQSPVTKVKMAKVKPSVMQPYSAEQIKKMLRVCDYDYPHGARFLDSRNRALILVLLDSGLRLSESANIKLQDMDVEKVRVKVTEKGNKERIVRIDKTAQKALWRYLVYRGENSN